MRVSECPSGMGPAEVTEYLNREAGGNIDLSLDVRVEDREDEMCRLGFFPGVFTLMVVPVWETTDIHYDVMISSRGHEETLKFNVSETKIMSILPWAYLPMLWHDWGFAGVSQNNRNWGRDNACRAEVLARLIKGQLTEELVELVELGREGVKERREQNLVAERAAQLSQEYNRQQLEERKMDVLRTFSLKEVPLLWEAYQNLKAGMDVQDKRITTLRQTMEEFNRRPDEDADFRSLVARQDEMARTLVTLRTRLEDAYLAYCKFKATPGGKGLGAQWRKALDEGLQAADEAKTRFDVLRQGK